MEAYIDPLGGTTLHVETDFGPPPVRKKSQEACPFLRRDVSDAEMGSSYHAEGREDSVHKSKGF